MGVNNKARRAAKKRKRETRGREADNSSRTAFSAGATDTDAVAAVLLAEAIGMVEQGAATAADLAARLLAAGAPAPPSAVARAGRRDLAMATERAGQAGWTPNDLGQLVTRRLTTEHLPALAQLLTEELRGHPAARVAAQWRAEVEAVGRPVAPALETVGGLTLGLGLSAVLGAVPPIPRLLPPPGQADPLAEAQQRASTGPAAKVLARVRGLLAKAESTEYPDEAEALSAKAQELISRHSLDQLLLAAAPEHASGPAPIVSRRLWIDAPYVGAKANLVHQVAAANRCTSVVAEKLGFTTVVGTLADLEAVELLATSLMVQADTAMLAGGRQVDRYGGSRTASYRRSFLLAYATRIGERLSKASDVAVVAAEEDGSGALTRLLRGHAERVDAAVAELFPHTVTKRSSVGNRQGWAAGMAAADAARLDVHRPIAR